MWLFGVFGDQGYVFIVWCEDIDDEVGFLIWVIVQYEGWLCSNVCFGMFGRKVFVWCGVGYVFFGELFCGFVWNWIGLFCY